jgi:hypothetical protein
LVFPLQLSYRFIIVICWNEWFLNNTLICLICWREISHRQVRYNICRLLNIWESRCLWLSIYKGLGRTRLIQKLVIWSSYLFRLFRVLIIRGRLMRLLLLLLIEDLCNPVLIGAAINIISRIKNIRSSVRRAGALWLCR